MSKISDLATDFKKKSNQQVLDTEQNLKSAFKQHEKIIESALSESEQKIKSGINGLNRRMSFLVLKTWLWLVLTIVMLLGAIQGVLWWQGSQIKDNWNVISKQNETIRQLKAKGGNIKLSQCEDRLCIPVAENGEGWTRKSDQRPMFIPEGY